ncbi:MAG: acetyl-CoA synthase subunit gamma [Clostridia bacterium]|jgi:hypothetical protein|nr:acetyl-CoA synthase subunit gamma [Clostridia bacterium]MBT7122982.1 acetyl-CoA synthase subunit gamma [Clostridia bacterium]
MSEKNEFLDISYCYTGRVKTPAGEIPSVSTELVFKDRCDAYKARWGIKRSAYRVKPAVYAIGEPNEHSPMLVTANYKLTFDVVRRSMDGQNAWLMVIDTKGVNVWCAAGKGTFGTNEVIKRIKEFKVGRIIAHKKLILPQLGATGVAAHEVTKATGFKVLYGPVDSKDLPEYISEGNTATQKMRTVKFGIRARIVLTPIELMTSLKYCLIALAFFFFFNWIGSEMFFSKALLLAILSTIPYLGAIIVGAVLVPALLPFLPFRAFSLKGLVLGAVYSAVLVLFLQTPFLLDRGIMFLISNLLIINALISYLALNFTGSSTYTSFTGAIKETKLAVLIMLPAAIVGLLLMIVDKIVTLV